MSASKQRRGRTRWHDCCTSPVMTGIRCLAGGAGDLLDTDHEGLLLPCFTLGHIIENVDHDGGVIALGEAHLVAMLIELDGAVEDRRRHSDRVSPVVDQAEIMRQLLNRALDRLESPLRHPWPANAELGGAAA